MSESLLMQIAPGAMELLKIAAQNDKGHLLFDNKALFNCLKALFKLHQLSRKAETGNVIDWLNLQGQPDKTSFLHTTAAFLRTIQSYAKNETGTEITDYDHFVLMAAAETLSEIMWQDKTETDIPGPELLECMDEFGYQDMKVIYQIFVKNYIGNVLQHLFESARIRIPDPKLYIETEMALKEYNAALVSNYVFSNITVDSNAEANAKIITQQLNLAHYLILSLA